MRSAVSPTIQRGTTLRKDLLRAFFCKRWLWQKCWGFGEFNLEYSNYYKDDKYFIMILWLKFYTLYEIKQCERDIFNEFEMSALDILSLSRVLIRICPCRPRPTDQLCNYQTQNIPSVEGKREIWDFNGCLPSYVWTKYRMTHHSGQGGKWVWLTYFNYSY